MKRSLALLALAGIHAQQNKPRRALAALTAATEDPEFNEAIDAINTAVSDDELPPELDEVVESSEDGEPEVDDLVDDVEALEPEEVEQLAESVISDDGLDMDADDLVGDQPEAVVSALLDAGAKPQTIQKHARQLLIAGVALAGDGDDDADDMGDLQGFDPDNLDGDEEQACGTPVKASVATDVSKVIEANLRAISSTR